MSEARIESESTVPLTKDTTCYSCSEKMLKGSLAVRMPIREGHTVYRHPNPSTDCAGITQDAIKPKATTPGVVPPHRVDLGDNFDDAGPGEAPPTVRGQLPEPGIHIGYARPE